MAHLFVMGLHNFLDTMFDAMFSFRAGKQLLKDLKDKLLIDDYEPEQTIIGKEYRFHGRQAAINRSPLVRIRKGIFNGDVEQARCWKELSVAFGPLYRGLQNDDWKTRKEEAWVHVLSNSSSTEDDQVDDQEETTRRFIEAIANIEIEARALYGGASEPSVDSLTSDEFIWMMILDGCFLLQVALLVLGGSKQLNYPRSDRIFGQPEGHDKAFIRIVMSSMFIVGNQVPSLVLKKLMQQSFFKKVFNQGIWKQPLGLERRVLFDQVIVPMFNIEKRERRRNVRRRRRRTTSVFYAATQWQELLNIIKERAIILFPAHLISVQPQLQGLLTDNRNVRRRRRRKTISVPTQWLRYNGSLGFPGKLAILFVSFPRDIIAYLFEVLQYGVNWVIWWCVYTVGVLVFPSNSTPSPSQEAHNLLHGLWSFMMGISDSNEMPHDKGFAGDDLQITVGGDSSTDGYYNVVHPIMRSATELKEAGINFTYYKVKGIKGIRFRTIFEAFLVLPRIIIDSETEMLLSNLIQYEVTQEQDESRRTICAYLQFMRELVQTPEDARLLVTSGVIVVAERTQENGLPSLFQDLPIPMVKTTHGINLSKVRKQLNRYTQTSKFKKILDGLSIVIFLTFLQTLYTLLSFHLKQK